VEKEWIDIVDTSVKIGLGALISGGFTYLGLRFKSKSEKERFMLEHKSRLLEEISSDIHEYLIAWRFLISAISGMTNHKERNNQDGSEFTDVQKAKIKERDEDLVFSWPKRESAIAKLTLLKANRVTVTLFECKELEAELRNIIIFDKEVPKYKYVTEYKARVRSMVDKVNNELSNFYSSL
jgi:hypothetical protein